MYLNLNTHSQIKTLLRYWGFYGSDLVLNTINKTLHLWFNARNMNSEAYLLLSPAGDSAPSMHLSSWLATICRSSSSSRVSRSNCSSYGKTFTAAITTRHPPWHGNLSLLFKTYFMPVRIKCKTHFVFGLHDLTDFSPAVSSLRDC